VTKDLHYTYYVVIRFIYTGSVEVTTVIAQDLLRAADQYLLEGLKRLCEYAIAQVDGISYFVDLLWVKIDSSYPSSS